MKKVVVIGSNSFSGSDFIDLLLEKNDYEIVGVSRSVEKSDEFLSYKSKNLKNFKFYQIDLNKDIDRLEKILDDFHPNYIVNFAAQSEVAPSWINPHHWFQTNAVALTNLANMLKDKKYIERYVHISSPEVYGSCEGFIKEDHPVNPSTPYAASKAAADLSLFTFYKNFNFPLVLVRSTNVYGQYQQLFKIIPRTIINIKMGKKIYLHGGGKAVKSYIHIRDISNGELSIMENGKIGSIYHLSPIKGISVKDLVDKICKIMNVEYEKYVESVEERLGQDKAYTIDSTKARNEFNWEPKIDIDLGLKQTIEWVNKYFEVIQKSNLEYCHKK
jgi:dTDP-glucose 4,6-dehydratase